MEIIAQGGFNSGRMYRAEGQRIFWALRPDGWLFFNDIDREVFGWIDMDNMREGYPDLDVYELMNKYDSGEYRGNYPGQSERNPSVPDGVDFGIRRRL